MGRRYCEVLQENPQYCNWVVQTADQNSADSDPQLLRFARWIRHVEEQEANGHPLDQQMIAESDQESEFEAVSPQGGL